MKLTGVDILRVSGDAPAGTSDGELTVQPLHRYEGDRLTRVASPGSSSSTLTAVYVRGSTDTGAEGLYGPIDPVSAEVIERGLRDVVIGTDPLAVSASWDRMLRSDRHSRHGHVMMGISAIDNLLWDIRGRHLGVPVYRLLGGPTRDRVNAYASTLGCSHDEDKLVARARQLAGEGYTAQKWFMAHGPADGLDGMRRNVALVQRLRAALGAGAPIMFDAAMGWDRAYAAAWLRSVEVYEPSWLEEPFGPDELAGYADLRTRSRVPLAAGEHLYGRWEVQRYLAAGALDVVQSDPEWCGGVSELTRICTVASLYGVPVIPHGHGLHAALHVAASQPPSTVPMVEYLFNYMPVSHHFEADPPAPAGGSFPLPVRPGFGITLDEAKIGRG